MDIEEAKKEFKIIIDTVREIFKQDVKEDDEDIYEIDGRQFLAIETALNELEKKDTVIDLMAKYISSLDTDEDICKNIQCTDGVNKIYKNCNDCVKQYFYKKAEEIINAKEVEDEEF